MSRIGLSTPAMPGPYGSATTLGPWLGVAVFVGTLLLLFWKVGLRARAGGPDPVASRAARMRLEGMPEGRVRRYVQRKRARRSRRRP